MNNRSPQEWLWVVRDKEKTLYEHEEGIIEMTVEAIKALRNKIKLLEATSVLKVSTY